MPPRASSAIRWLRSVARRGGKDAILDLAFLPLALVTCWSLLAVGGMPMTHDGLGLAFLEAYRRAYQAGDWFPLWTSFSENGHGSGFPILYHRLHGQVFGVLALKVGALMALKVSIPAVLVVGAAGMRRLSLALGVRPWLAWLGGVLLVSANYAVTDWFVRGATAELTAFMLVPWCLRDLLRAFDDRWGPVRFAVSSALLFYAHMMVFYVFVLVAMVIVAGRLLELSPFGWARVRPVVRRGAIFVALLTCAIGPYAAAMKYVVAFSGLPGITSMRTDAEAYFPATSYFADPDYSYSRSYVHVITSVEVGRWMVLSLAAILLVSSAARAAVRRRVGALAVIAVVLLVLQRKELAWVFTLLPGLSSLQFPSRILVIIVPIVILCTTVAFEAALRSYVPWVRVAAAALPFVATAGQLNLARSSQSAIWGQQVPKSEIEEAMAKPLDVTTGAMAMYGDWHRYAPNRQGSPKAAPFLLASPGCAVSSPTLTAGALAPIVVDNVPCRSLSFTVHGGNCEIRINQFQSSILRADFSAPGELRSTEEGTTLLVVPKDGTEVRFDQRSVLDLARKWLTEKTSRWP
ncbi:MAG: hypothetical protein ABSE49_03690 [Polyangiaceae bacterium]